MSIFIYSLRDPHSERVQIMREDGACCDLGDGGGGGGGARLGGDVGVAEGCAGGDRSGGGDGDRVGEGGGEGGEKGSHDLHQHHHHYHPHHHYHHICHPPALILSPKVLTHFSPRPCHLSTFFSHFPPLSLASSSIKQPLANPKLMIFVAFQIRDSF